MKFVNLIFFLFLFICYNSFSQEQVVGYVIVQSDTDIEVFSDTISSIPKDIINFSKSYLSDSIFYLYYFARENQLRFSLIASSQHRFHIMINDSTSHWIDKKDAIASFLYIVQSKRKPKGIVSLQTKKDVTFYEDSLSTKPIKQKRFCNCNNFDSDSNQFAPLFYICDNDFIELLEFYSTDTSLFRVQIKINDSIQYWVEKQDILHYDTETIQVLNSVILPYTDSIFYAQNHNVPFSYIERGVDNFLEFFNKKEIHVDFFSIQQFYQNRKNIYWPQDLFIKSCVFEEVNGTKKIENKNEIRFISAVKDGKYKFDNPAMFYAFSKPYFINENMCLFYYFRFSGTSSGIYEFIILEKKNNEWEKIYTAASGVF